MSTWGVAHAPGYPLLCLLGNLAAHLPHLGETAFVLNLMNASFAALACAAMAFGVQVLTGQKWAGLAAGLALGTSRIYWEYSLANEVFALNALLGALLLALLAIWLRTQDGDRPRFSVIPVSALIMSSVLTHHPTLLLLAGPILLVYAVTLVRLARRGKVVNAARVARDSIALAGLGLLLMLYIPLAARFDPPMNWGNARDVASLLGLILRRDFGTGRLLDPGIVVNQVLEQGESASPLGMRPFALFWANLPHTFGWVFPPLVILGLLWSFRRSHPILALSILFLVMVTLFFTRVNAPVVPLYVGIAQKFYILPHLYLAFLAGLGVAQATDWASRVHARGRVFGFALIIAGTSVAMSLATWHQVDMSGNTFTRGFGANLMAGMPARAIVFTDGDMPSNSFLYQQVVLGHRPDLALVDQPMMTARWYIEQLRRRQVLQLPPGMSIYSKDLSTQGKVWIDLNGPGAAPPHSHPIVATQFIDDTFKEGYRLIPMGLWSAVRPKAERSDLRTWVGDYAAGVRQWELESLDRAYAPTSWETNAGAFYPYALGTLRALTELVRVVSPRDSVDLDVRAVAVAERWQGKRRAEYLAYQADLWRACVTDSLVRADANVQSLMVTRSMALARASLSLDPGNLQALQTTAALLSSVPHLRDPRLEVQIRHRIVLERPGDLGELIPYFQSVVAVMRDPALSDPALLDQAEDARRRFVRLVGLCQRIWSNPVLAQLHEQWSVPLKILAKLP